MASFDGLKPNAAHNTNLPKILTQICICIWYASVLSYVYSKDSKAMLTAVTGDLSICHRG